MKTLHSKKFWLVVLVLTLTVLLTGWSGNVEEAKAAQQSSKSEEESTITKGGTLVYGAWQAADVLDPRRTGLAATSRMLRQIFDTLIYKKSGSDEFYPGLAASWEVSADAKHYTFTLRKNVTFHDGTPFNSEAVKYTFDSIMEPNMKSLAARGALGPYKSSEVLGEYKIRVYFKEGYAPFLNMVAGPVLSIVSPTAARKMGDDFANHPVGTGPFKVKEFVPEDHLTLVRNPDYNWNPGFFQNQGPPPLDKIEWRIIPEDGTRMATLDTGEANVIEYMVPAAVQRYKRDSNFTVDLVNAPGAPRMAMLNTQKPPLNDVKVRKALVYAIDRNAIVNTLYKGVYEVAYGPLEPATFGYSSEVKKYYPYNIEKAKSLLDEAGWKDSDGDRIRDKNGQPLHLLFIVAADDQFDEIAQMMQAQAKQVGINMELQFESSPTVWDTYMQGKDLHIGEIFWWNNDPQTLYSIWHSSQIGSGWNISRYKNSEVDQLIEQSLAEGGLEKRAALITKIQLKIMDDAPFVPIHGKRSVMAYNSNLKGFKYSDEAIPYLYDVNWIK